MRRAALVVAISLAVMGHQCGSPTAPDPVCPSCDEAGAFQRGVESVACEPMAACTARRAEDVTLDPDGEWVEVEGVRYVRPTAAPTDPNMVGRDALLRGLNRCTFGGSVLVRGSVGSSGLGYQRFDRPSLRVTSSRLAEDPTRVWATVPDAVVDGDEIRRRVRGLIENGRCE